MENGLNLTYSQYLSRRFSIQSGRNNLRFIDKPERNPALRKPFKPHRTSELTQTHPDVDVQFLTPIATKSIALPHHTVQNLKILNASDLRGSLKIKTLLINNIQTNGYLSERLKKTINEISQAISSIIPIEDQEVILQTDNNPFNATQPKFDWHWDFFEPTFRLFKDEKDLPEFPHIFAYSGERFTPTELTELPNIDIASYPGSFNQFKDDLKQLKPTFKHTRNRCQIISSKHLHRAPNDRDDNFLLIGFRSVHEKRFFNRLSDYYIEQDAAKVRLSKHHRFYLPKLSLYSL